MRFLASLFVGKPLNILAVAGVFVAGFFALRVASFGAGRHPRALLAAAGAWALYAAWERLVQMRSPEANIRVDLMLIWSVLAVVSAWSLFRALR
jgi:hypothetical protein